MQGLSLRVAELIDALPLHPGMRMLEIGGGPGVAARAVARRIAAGPDLGAGTDADPAAGGRFFIDGRDPLRQIGLPDRTRQNLMGPASDQA